MIRRTGDIENSPRFAEVAHRGAPSEQIDIDLASPVGDRIDDRLHAPNNCESLVGWIAVIVLAQVGGHRQGQLKYATACHFAAHSKRDPRTADFNRSGDFMPLSLALVVAGDACGNAHLQALSPGLPVEQMVVFKPCDYTEESREGVGDFVKRAVDPGQHLVVNHQAD